MNAPRLAIFPGSFDPLTVGHVDLIRRAAHLFDRLVVAVLINPHKQSLFSVEERLAHIRAVAAELPEADRVEADAFEGLLVHYAQRRDACAVVRGSAPLRHEGRWLTRDLSRCPDVPMGFGSLRSSARARVYRFMRMSGHRDKSLETPVSWARGCPDMPNSIGTRSGHRDTNRRPRSARLEREGAITGPRVVAADGRATPGPRGAKPGVPTPSDARSLPTARWPSDLA